MAETDRAADLAEAYKRGILPPDLKRDYEEALRRGLLPSGEPTFAEGVAAGFAAPGVGALQIAGQIPGGSEAMAAVTSAVSPKKAEAPQPQRVESIPRRPVEPVSFGGLLTGSPSQWGQVVGGLPVGGGIAGGLRMLPKSVGPGLRTALGGGLMGGLQPVEEGQAFVPTKAAQVGEGLALGYGLHVGGKALSAGVDAIAQRLAQHYPSQINRFAIQAIMDRIEKDVRAGGPRGLSALKLLDLIDEAHARGTPFSLSDVAGKNLQGLAGAVYRKGGGGIAEGMYGPRDKETLARLMTAIREHMSGGPSVYEATELLDTAQKAASRPLYEATDKLQFIWSERLAGILSEPELKQAMKAGYAFERRMARAEDRPFDPTMMGLDVDVDGNIKLLRTPNMRVLDMAKRGLDHLIQQDRKENFGKLSQNGVSLNALRQAYVREIDNLDTSGVYRRARAAYAGPARSKEMLELGEEIFSSSPEEVTALVRDATPSELEFYRMGVAGKMRERILQSDFSADEAKKLVRNPWQERLLRPVFKTPQDYDEFVNKIVPDETRMFNMRRAITGGSQTAERQAEEASPTMQMIESGAQLIGAFHSGKIMHTVSSLWRFMDNMRIAKNSTQLNEAIAKILFSTDRESIRSILRVNEPAPGWTPRMAPGVRAAAPFVAPAVAGSLARQQDLPEENTVRFDAQGNRLQ
jgi:hypothetical protein